jgi:hypothetical protein
LSQPAPITGPTHNAPDVRASIARASAATGVDFQYLLAQARLESSLDPSARAGTSSAAGLYQFTQGTWLDTLDAHGSEHGLGWAGAAIEGGRVRDPAMRQQIMALRYDPDASALMAAELASDNSATLTQRLGRAPDAAELYLAHFLGAEGAGKFLSALQSDPGQSAAALLPAAAGANCGIFYTDGAPRSVGAVMDLMRGKVNRAMGQDGAGFAYAQEQVGGGWAASPLASSGGTDRSRTSLSPETNGHSARPSMAETLRTTFALGNSGTALGGPQVRAAYAQLKAFGL